VFYAVNTTIFVGPTHESIGVTASIVPRAAFSFPP
jgi:hypothetical protein